MSNVHVHLHVSDLEASRRFCEQFLDAQPGKVRPGYVNFLPAMAPINLALSSGHSTRGQAVSHLGFQVDTKEAVQALLGKAKAAGLTVREEMDTSCCYANQDKFWVVDPDGLAWEVYHLNYDLDDDATTAAQTACCAPTELATIVRRP